MFVPGKLFQPSLMVPTLPANIRLGWKGLPGTNTLTYFTTVKSFITFGPEDEISLKYLPRDHGYRYEMSNCLFESAFENILEKCKCFPGNLFFIFSVQFMICVPTIKSQGEAERQTHREMEIQRDGETEKGLLERQIDRETERDRERQRDTKRQTEMESDGMTERLKTTE